jgi:hypothetical protein
MYAPSESDEHGSNESEQFIRIIKGIFRSGALGNVIRLLRSVVSRTALFETKQNPPKGMLRPGSINMKKKKSSGARSRDFISELKARPKEGRLESHELACGSIFWHDMDRAATFQIHHRHFLRETYPFARIEWKTWTRIFVKNP